MMRWNTVGGDRQPLGRIGVLVLLCFCLATPSTAPLEAAGRSAVSEQRYTEASDKWYTDKPAKVLASSADTLYIGGEFTEIGQGASGFAAFTSDGQYDWTLPHVGTVRAIAPDGAGGLFLNSENRPFGGSKSVRLIHLRADHSVDPSWAANANQDGVLDIAVDSQRVYTSSYAAVFDGRIIEYKPVLAAYDRTTGNCLWKKIVDPVTAFTASDGVLYVGFTFESPRPVIGRRLAAFDGATGAVTPWNPNPNNVVNSIVVSGGTMYIGGRFTEIDGTPHKHIAALDPLSGRLNNVWSADTDNEVISLLAHGDAIYAGGLFLNANGQPRAHLAAFSPASGALTPWKPESNLDVWKLAIDGDRLYASVRLPPGSTSTAYYLTAFDLATGAALPFNVKTDGGIANLVAANGRIFASGWFQGVNLVERQHIAAVDRATGLIKDWAPAIDGPVETMLAREDTLYIAGPFTTVAGTARPGAAALDTRTGSATAWNPRPNVPMTTLADGGDVIYAGGTFTTVNSPAVERRFLAAFDAATGAVTSWSPSPDGPVSNLVLSETTLFVGGRFLHVAGVDRETLASFDRASGALKDWHPSTWTDEDSPLVLNGTTLYTVWQGKTRAIDATTGGAVSWDSIIWNYYPVRVVGSAGDVLYGLITTPGRTTYIVGVERSSGVIATCGVLGESVYGEDREVLVRDGIVYDAWKKAPANSVSVLASQPPLCRNRAYLPLIARSTVAR